MRVRAIRSRWVCACLAAWTASVSPSGARAQTEQLRAVVRASGELDRALLGRIRGQLSDLQVELIETETGALEPTFALQLARAEMLAKELAAPVVVWFNVSDDGQVLVYVATPETGRVLVRRLRESMPQRGADGAAIGSGRLEAAALVVRFALAALSQGGSIGVAKEDAIAAAAASGSPHASADTPAGAQARDSREPPRPQAASNGAAQQAPARRDGAARSETAQQPESRDSDGAARSDALAAWWALGYRATADGFSAGGSHGISLRASLQNRPWSAALYGTLCLPVTRRDALTEIRIARHSAGAAFGLLVPLSGELFLTAAAAVSLLVITRASAARSAAARAEPSRTSLSAALGPELQLAYRSGRLGAAIGLGLDVVPRPTRFSYRGGAEDPEAQLAVLEPHASLAAEVRWP